MAAQSKPPAKAHAEVAAGHFVEFYESEELLAEHIADFARRALATGSPMLIIAEPRRLELLARAGADIQAALRAGKIVTLDSRATLATFMVGESPSAARFEREVGSKLEALGHGVQRVWAYGDMVNLLWREGNPGAALELEALWNTLCRRTGVPLMCAYHKANFIREAANGEGIADVCRIHDHVVPAQRTTPVPILR